MITFGCGAPMISHPDLRERARADSSELSGVRDDHYLLRLADNSEADDFSGSGNSSHDFEICAYNGKGEVCRGSCVHALRDSDSEEIYFGDDALAYFSLYFGELREVTSFGPSWAKYRESFIKIYH